MRRLQELFQSTTSVLFHAFLVALSAGLILSLPFLATWTGARLSAYRSLIVQDKLYLVSGETALAILLVLAMNYVYRSERNRRMAKIAQNAGLEFFVTAGGGLMQRKIRRLKIAHGLAKSMMVIGVTGAKTLMNPSGDLHFLLENCLEAKILLLNPECAAAWARSKALHSPGATKEKFQEEILQTIQHLKRISRPEKPISLKLYSDPPLFKLAILGDHIWLQHYHPEFDVQTMPQYAFKHNQDNHGLYMLFYQYFIKRWENADIPEYDLETNMLVFRGGRTAGKRPEAPISMS